MLNENIQISIKNGNSLSKLESSCAQNSTRSCSCSHGFQTFDGMSTELNSGNLQNDTMLTHSVSESSNTPRNAEISHNLNSYNHSVPQTFNLPTNSVQELRISAVSHSAFPTQIPAVIPTGVSSSNIPLSPLLFHPRGPYILPNPTSANLSSTHLQPVNHQLPNLPLNTEYKNISPSGVLEATTHNPLPLVTGTLDGSVTNSSKTSPSSQSIGANKGTNENGNYYVMVHVDAGETFSVRVGDQIQHIPGPATVRMVSNSGPPLPMPMQVPPGHLVQQIVDEEGILTHVILSPYPTPPLSMVATGGVPMSINQTNDVSTAGANLILNPNQHLQPHHPHPHLHPLLPSPGIPTNENLIHMNPYTLPHPQAIPGHPIHPFPPPPPQFIHPHLPHFHQQFNLHSPQAHVCAAAAAGGIGEGDFSTKYPVPSDIANDTNHCDMSTGSTTYLTNDVSELPSNNPSKQSVVKVIPDSTTTNITTTASSTISTNSTTNNCINGDNNNNSNNSSSDITDTHSDTVTINKLHPLVDGYCDLAENDVDKVSIPSNNKKSISPESSLITDSSLSNDDTKTLKSSKCSSNQTNGYKNTNGVCHKQLCTLPKKKPIKCNNNNGSSIADHTMSSEEDNTHIVTHNGENDDDDSDNDGDDDDGDNDNGDDDEDDDDDDEDAAITSTCGYCDDNDSINCEQVGSYCTTTTTTSASMIVADSSSSITDVKHLNTKNHLSMENSPVLNGSMTNSDPPKSSPSNTAAATTTTSIPTTTVPTTVSTNNSTSGRTKTTIPANSTTTATTHTVSPTTTTVTTVTTSTGDNGRITSGLNAFSSSYSSSYPPTTFPSYRRRRGGGGGVMGMNSTSGIANNKNYPNFRSYNRPVNFGNNKSLQNSVWNQSSFITSKSNSDYYHHHQQHPDGLQNGSINNNNSNNNNNNHTNHYQQHYPSPSYHHQPYPSQHSQHTYHRGPVITGGVGTTAQELDMDSEAEIEKGGIAHLSTCAHLPVNILLPTVQSPSAYCPQPDCILNSQCYDHHHHDDHHHHAHPHPHHLHQQSTESFDACLNGDTVGVNGSIAIDNDAVVISTTNTTANNNNNIGGDDDDFNSTATNTAWSTQDKIIHNLLSNLLAPQVTEVKSHSALIQLSFPQDLIHSSIGKAETETTTLLSSTSSSTTTSTTITTTNSEISSSTTTAASTVPTDYSSLSSLQSRTFPTENNTHTTNTTKSCKPINSPVKSPRHKYKASVSSPPTPKMTTTTKMNSSKSELNNGIISSNTNTTTTNNNDNADECYNGNGNHESKAASNTVTSNTNGIDNNSQNQITIDLDAIQFELHLTERCSTPQFKCVFIGEATFISLQDLRPGTNYCVKVCCNYAGIRGDFSPIAHFVTLPSKPNPPRTIQIICQTRNSLHIKWGPGIDNGSRITSYKLEYAQVSTNSSEMGMDKNTDPEFFEPIQVFGRSYKINQLSPSTEYLIRVAAINQYGQSSWSPILSASTSGSPPDMPSPPFLIQADVHSLTLGWRPPSNLTDQYQYHSHHYHHHHLHHHHLHHHHHHLLHDNLCEQTNPSSYSNHLNPITYTLEMDDQAMGHGFVTVFDGTGTEHCVDNLRRNTRYRFRLAASNLDGRSRWSETVTLATLPDHPSPPRNLRIYGSLLQPTRLALTWDPPEDDGGIPIQSYRLEALLPYSSNSSNANLINGIPLASINNESGLKLNDVNNSNVNYSLEKIDDHLDVIQKLTCWPHVTVLKPDSSILSSINSSCSPNMITTSRDETYIVNSCDNLKTYTIVNEDKKSYSRVSETDSNVNDGIKVTENNKTNKTAVITTTTSTTLSTNISPSTMFNTDYDGESNYPQTAWFIIYEGREKELLLENLLPGFFLQLRVRACCSLLTNKMNPSCSAFSSSPASSASSSSSSSSSVSSGAASVSNLHNYPNDISFGVSSTAVTAVTTSTNVNSNVGIGSNGRNGELWGLASHPPLKIRMPPIPPSAPSSGPRVIGKPKPTSLHLSWSPPKQTGGAAILAYEVWQLILEPTSWVDEESEDNDSNISIPRYCSSTPSSSLETSLLPLSCHNLQYYSTYNKYTSHCHSSHRQPILHRSYTDSSLNTKSYTLNNDNPVKLQSLFNDETTAVGVHGRFVCSVRENECRLFGLIPGQNYAFRVRAYNRAGKGLWTEWVSISTPPSLPGVPASPPRLLPKSSRTIHIAWDPVTCINGAKIYEYRLECRQYQLSKAHDYYNVAYMPSIAAEKKGILNHSSSSSSSSSHDNSSRNDTMEQADDDSFFQLIYAGSKLSFELTDLQPATLFAFRFCAVNSAGAGPWSSIAKCWTPSAPPDQPHGLCVREINYNSALIIWCIPQCNGSPITSFTIELTRFGHNIATTGGSISSSNNNKAGSGGRTHTDVNYIQIPAPYLLDYDGKQMNSSSKQQQQQHHTNVSTTENSNNNIQFQRNVIQHCLSKLKPSTNYMLRIQAVNKFGPSEYSVQTEFTTLAPLPQPPAFSQYKNLTSNSVRLEWNLLANHMNSDGDDDYDNAGDDSSNIENASSNAENHENDKNAQNDNDGSGDGGEEDEVTSHEEVHMNNSNSNHLRHNNNNNNNAKQQQQNKLLKKQKATFKSLESQVTFTLQMSREPDLEWTTIYEGQANVHKVNRLCESTVYHFRVRATNTTGSGPYSTIQTIRTQKSSPPAVRGLKIIELSSDRCQLEWTPVNQLGMDPIVYLLHLLPVSPNTQQSTNLSQVYRGNLPACRITGLNPASEYVCRVCAVRLCQPNKLPVISNSSYSSSEQEQLKVNSSTDSSQYQITELPGPFSPGLVFTTPRLNKDGHSDSMSTNCHSFKQNSSSKRSTFLRILSLPFQTVRCILSFGRSSNTPTAHRINDSSNSITLSKHHQTHSNQVTAATGTSSNSTGSNASDKRRPVLISTATSSSTVTSAAAASMSSVSPLTSSVSTTSTPRNQSKQSSSSSKRSHSWFRFTDTQLACLLLILFSLATLLVAISLQYLLNVHLKISNPTATVSTMDYSSYEVKLRSNNEDTSDSTLFTSTTTT